MGYKTLDPEIQRQRNKTDLSETGGRRNKANEKERGAMLYISVKTNSAL